MKRTPILALVSLFVLLGLLFVWFAGPDGPGLLSEPDAERSTAHDLDASVPDLAAGESLSVTREVADVETRLLPGDPMHISGIVVNSSEEPIEGAICRILDGRAPTGLEGLISRPAKSQKVVATSSSDEFGTFQIEVPEGFWVLRVEAEEMSPWEEAFLRRGDFRWVQLGPAREMTVYVRDDTAQAISGAEVRFLKGAYFNPQAARLTERTNGAGAAHFTSIPSGTWYVHVSHPEYVSNVRKLPSARSLRKTFEVVLTRGTRIVGKVILGDGRVPPFPARILFETPDGFTSSHEVESGPDGHYASRVVFPAYPLPIEVTALVPGFGESQKDVSLGEPPSSGEITVDFVLDSFERHVVGRVLDPHGLPLAGIEVYVKTLVSLPPETLIQIPSGAELEANGWPNLDAFDPVTSMVGRLRRAATSDAGGRFRVSGLHARKPYKLLLISEEYSNAVLWVEAGEPGSVTDLGSVRLEPEGRVWGYVRRPDGSPIEGALVQTSWYTHREIQSGGEFQTRRPTVMIEELSSITNRDGLFSIQPIPKGGFRLYCLGILFGPYELSAGETLGPLDLVGTDSSRRERILPVVLTVMDQLHEQVPRSYAEMRRVRPESGEPDTPFPLYAFGDASGRIELGAPEEGIYEVTVKHLRGQFADQSFRIDLTEEGIFQDVVLLEQDTQPLEGVVENFFGAPLADVVVVLIAGNLACNCSRWKVRTDEEGVFSFGPVMVGNHRLLVTDPKERFSPARYYPARPGHPIVVTMR